MPWIILIVIVVILVLFVVGVYNNLISLKLRVENAWSQIDTQLKRRFDLIPNLVETVKGYAKHESETLEKVILKMKDGEVSDPIAYGNDYYIYKLERTFNPETDAKVLPTRKEIVSYLENKKLEEFSNKYMKDLRSHALIEKKIWWKNCLP